MAQMAEGWGYHRSFRSVSLEEFIGAINFGAIRAPRDCHHNQEIGHDDPRNPVISLAAAIGNLAAAFNQVFSRANR